MQRVLLSGWLCLFLAGVLVAQEAPVAATPLKEHEWLQQFVGEWDFESEAIFAPGQPPVKCKGSEKVRMLGKLWIISELNGDIEAQMTVGYNPDKKKYVGTWIDSMFNHMWKYEGTVDTTGKILTLEAEGPNPEDPTKTTKFRDVTEFVDKDHRMLRSYLQGNDGQWVQFMTGHFHRKKAK